MIEYQLEIDASPETVYALWTTPEGLCRWWAVAAEIDPRPGGVIRLDIGGPVMLGEFLTLDPPRRVVFTFGWIVDTPEGPLPPGSTTVEVTITPTAGGCRVAVHHRGLPEECVNRHRAGWSHFLALLAGAATSREETG